MAVFTVAELRKMMRQIKIVCLKSSLAQHLFKFNWLNFVISKFSVGLPGQLVCETKIEDIYTLVDVI